MMFVYNLAEPLWVPVHCEQKFLTQLICIKDLMSENITSNRHHDFILNKYTCASKAILVNDMCYEFHWVNNISRTECANKYTNIDIMILPSLCSSHRSVNPTLIRFIGLLSHHQLQSK